MILINGLPLETEEFLKKYDHKSIEREIVTILSTSEEDHNYDTLDSLQFELMFRKEIVHAADMLNKSGIRFKVFRESKCNDDYWERMSNGGFKLKKDVKPSLAIGDIYTNGKKYGTECATAILIVYFGALLNIFSAEYYDELFSEIILMNWSRIHPLLKEVGWVKEYKDALPGDRRYFDNPDVDPLHPEWQGENVIDMGGGIYYGHGAGKRTAKQFIEKLNTLRKKNAKKSAYLMNKAAWPNFSNFEKLYEENEIALSL